MKNLLLIVIDCARTEKTVQALPHSTEWTARSARLPFIESLRERGTTWTHLNALSSTTTPNFASLFTGLLPVEHGIVEHSRYRLDREATTLAQLLKKRGYHTYAEMTGPLIPEAGLDRGFDHYRYRERTEYLHRGFDNYLGRFLPLMKAPWFLCLHLWEAHSPFQNPPPFDSPAHGKTPYDRALSLVDDRLAGIFGGRDFNDTAVILTSDHGERLVEDYMLNQRLGGTEWPVLAARQHYIEQCGGRFDYDRWFEFARDALGEETARIHAHNVTGHGFHLTDDLIRVPLVIVDPERCAPGAKVDALRSQVDLFHTCLDLAGAGDAARAAAVADVTKSTGSVDAANASSAKAARGRSLLDFEGDDRIYIEANGSGGKQYASRCYLRGARTARWKYWRLEGGARPHAVLWDLECDPRETVNCIGAHPDIAADLDAFVDRCLSRRSPAPAAATDEEAARIEAKMRELGYL